MLLTANSSWPYVQGPYAIGLRYGSAYDIMLNEILPGPWGGYNKLNMANGIWGFEQKYSLPKLLGYFEYTDKTAGIGYLHLVNVAFSTDELLLCRAEAKLLKTPQDIDGAVADINILLNSMAGINLTKDPDCQLLLIQALHASALEEEQPAIDQEGASPSGILHPGPHHGESDPMRAASQEGNHRA